MRRQDDRGRRGGGHHGGGHHDRDRERERRPERRPPPAPELVKERTVVLPGQQLDGADYTPGYGTYREEGKIYASVAGMLSIRPPVIKVIPFSGPYIPQDGDIVIAIVKMVGASFWLVDLRAPHYTPLHHSGTPWKVEYGECGEYLHPGDAVVVRVERMEEQKRMGVTMNGDGLGRLQGGVIEEISPTKVPRVIGKSGSMIKMIQQATGTRMTVGQNGRVWIDGEPASIFKVRQALEIIDREGQKSGLTDKIKLFLER